MKIIVISEETRQRLLSEDPMLDAIESSKTKKEKELEKKKKEAGQCLCKIKKIWRYNTHYI